MMKRRAQKTVQETYQMLTPIQHVLKRPDTYVGSLEKHKELQWILAEDRTNMIQRTLEYSPALYKIYDEVIVNAADSYQRHKNMNLIEITISETQGFVTIKNNGKGIPIVKHKETNLWVPEMIFGNLFAGSNFNDDDDKRYGGGRNGFGAKLANILSKVFILNCADNENKKKFSMTWSENMSVKTEPIITPFKGSDFVEVTFYPDFKRFGMEKFEPDIVRLFKKRAYDMAGIIPQVKVILNGEQLSVRSFSSYVDLYLNSEDSKEEKENIVKVTLPKGEKANEHWEVILSRSDGEPRQVSFVNGICTYKGGTHSNYVLDQIIPKISEKLKNASIKPQFIKSKLFVFINCLIVNPSFDSQLKETLTTRVSAFGSTWQMPEKMIKAILATGIVEELANEAEARQMTKMAKVTAGGKKSRVDVPKLEDANDAGKKDSDKCVLILTEGDSAKALAVSGLSVLGRDKYGVFPLRGKLMNVREKDKKTVLDNVEISNIVKILGLQYNKKYELADLKSLRYGSIMIMTDQDHDGSHIKGLIINMIHYYWPSLFRIKGFLRQFITPLLKANKGGQSESFFTMQDYLSWKDAQANSKSWKIKYYKGLGTSTSKQGQEYFKNLNVHEKIFTYQDAEDDGLIDLAFSKKKTDERKQWLAGFNENNILELGSTIKEITYKDFINKELIHFSHSSNRRAIPSIIDGLKPGQRKILFSCFKRKLKEEIKVAQLAGYVAEHSAYHHGEMSLTQTIIMLAQNYVGSNNINLLMPNGQFGSRAEGGSDHASARYVFTCLNKVTRNIFIEDDDHTLHYLEDDGQVVEPEYYVPIIPMVLVNGAEGMGTGWSTNITTYNPRDLVNQLKRRLEGEEFTEPLPWYKNFEGEVLPVEGGIKTRGIVNEDSNSKNTVHITELPIGKWTIKVKEDLVQFIKNDKYVVGFREYHTQNKVHFQVELTQDFMSKQNAVEKVYDFLKLSTSKKFSNMVGFDGQNHIHRYKSVVEILEEFYNLRMKHYIQRKTYLISRLTREVEINRMKVKFINEMIEEKFKIRKETKDVLFKMMEGSGYTKECNFTKIVTTKKAGKEAKQGGEQSGNEGQNNDDKQSKSKTSKAPADDADELKEFHYLLHMTFLQLSAEHANKITNELEKQEEMLILLHNTSEKMMWEEDLNKLMVVLDQVEEQERKERMKADELAKGIKGKNKKIGKRVRKTKNVKDSDDEDEEPVNKKGGKKRGGRSASPSSKKSETSSSSELKSSNLDESKSKQKKKKGKRGKKAASSIDTASKQPTTTSRQTSPSKRSKNLFTSVVAAELQSFSSEKKDSFKKEEKEKPKGKKPQLVQSKLTIKPKEKDEGVVVVEQEEKAGFNDVFKKYLVDGEKRAKKVKEEKTNERLAHEKVLDEAQLRREQEARNKRNQEIGERDVREREEEEESSMSGVVRRKRKNVWDDDE